MILVIDDSRDMQDLIRMALHDDGFDVVTAANGKEALDILRRGQTPNLILLDSKMDVMDGETFLRELESLYTDRKIPIVVISGSDGTLDSRFIVRKLRKPVDLNVLREIAQEYN